MHFLTKLSLYNRWITLFIVLALIGVGLYATFNIQQEMIPNIELPMATVVTIYPGASPQVVVDEISKPVEEAIAHVGGQKQITSTSTDASGVGVSVVFVEYEYGTNMATVVAKIKAELAPLTWPQAVVAMASSPDVGENPKVSPINMGMIPLASYSLVGELDPSELRSMALTNITPELQKVEGVQSVSVDGGEERVIITPKIADMNAKGIAISQVVAALRAGDYGSLANLTASPVDSAGTKVGDVATVTPGPKPGTVISRVDGKPSVLITIMKKSDANVVKTSDRVSNALRKATVSLTTDGNGLHLEKVSDQADYVKSSLTDLKWEAVIGGVLAILVIWMFLVTLRGSLVIAISIPLSILIGFAVMKAWGITLNVLTLSAMGIAVGRIVDDSIVILEVIYRHLRSGEPFKEAAVSGSKEVAMAITSATLATVAIFLPLAFVKGIVGEMFVPFALTVTFALLASLLVALTVVPALSSVLVRKQTKTETEDAWYQRVYTPVLRWALRHRFLTVAIALGLLLLSLGLTPLLGTSFMSSMGGKGITVSIKMKPETGIVTTSDEAKQVEAVIETLKGQPGSKLGVYSTTVSTSSSSLNSLFGGGGGGNTASVQVALSKNANVDKEVEALRQALAASALAPDLESEVIKVQPLSSDMGGDSSQFAVYVKGDVEAQVETVAKALADKLKSVNGLTDVETDIATVVRKPVIVEDNSTEDSYGLNPTTLGTEMYVMKAGTDLSGASVGGIPIYVGGVIPGAATEDETGDELRGLWLYGGLSSPIQLGDIAPASHVVSEATSIRRIDQNLAVSITGTVTKKDVGAVSRAAQKEMDAVTGTVEGVTTQAGGVTEEMNQAFRDMLIAIIIAVAISFGILIASFRSLISPLIIIMSLPLASIGAVLALLASGQSIGVSALMGILMLVGIVLTNAIVLIALVEQLRHKGMSTHDALVQGGRTRIRPILMTAMATMLALIPLAIGWPGGGVLLASELAVVVMGGLVSSTLLTLVVIPVLYSLSERFRRRAKVTVPVTDTTTEKPPGA